MLSELLKVHRRQLGISQVALSALSGVSLPTIQNIEMDKANPSYATLEALCRALKLKVSLEQLPPNLELLISVGLPLTSENSFSTPLPKQDELREELIKLCLFIPLRTLEEERLREAAQGFLLAIRSHYPTWFHSNLSAVPAVLDLMPKTPSGRVIKFSRQAREKLSKIL